MTIDSFTGFAGDADATDLRERAHEDGFEELKKQQQQQQNVQLDVRPTTSRRTSTTVVSATSMDELRQHVVKDMVGHDRTFVSPFEWKEEHTSGGSHVGKSNKDELKVRVPMVYCDFTASHRPVSSIEEYLQRECTPFYGNTHTNTSITGSQSSAFVSEARQIIAEACGAKTTGKASEDVVLFAGNGTTSSVQLLIDCLGLKHYETTTNGNDAAADGDLHKPLVMLGPMEHHSNLLPWREIGSDKVDIEMVQYDRRTGTVDVNHLERILQRHKDRPSLKIGSFTAASNLTGTLVDDRAITALLHRNGALSFWDYATGASYLDMNMNPSAATANDDASLLSKDAIFFSGHKLLGGVGTPGVLIVKKRIVSSINPPERCGGGTVFYVTDDHHRFLSSRVERYEGGTPDVVGIWRLGLAFKLKQSIKHMVRTQLLVDRRGPDNNTAEESKEDGAKPTTLVEYDLMRAQSIQRRLKVIPNLVLVDGKATEAGTPKLPVFSFLVACGSRFLHYNYVCALLNDLFGIQSRGGCQCAGPYAQLLLGLDDDNEKVEEWLVRTKDELLRPGVTRLSIPTLGTTKEQEIYVVDAIAWVAKNGWKLLHVYRCNHRSGEWRHKSRPGAPLGIHERRWLSHYRMLDGTSSSLTNGDDGSTGYKWSLQNTMANADKMLELVVKDQSSIAQALKMVDDDDNSSTLRWYVYPKDVARYLRDGLDEVPLIDGSFRLLGALHPLVLQVDAFVEAEQHTTRLPSDDVKPDIPPTSMTHFCDGEHVGEAPFEEILEGFDNGELSDQCLVYFAKEDNWQLLSSLAAKGTGSQVAEPTNNATHNNVTEDLIEPNHDGTIDTQAMFDVEPDIDLPLMERNERKKPQRDASTWGKGQVQTSQPLMEGNENGAQTENTCSRRKSRHVKPPPKLMRQVTQAMVQWDMLEDGDRLMLGLSGGKDSLSLLHILLEFQRKLPIRFEIEVCTIDPMTPSFDPSPLIPYVESLGLKYHYVRDDIVERAATSGKDGKIVSSLCAYCARMKRGNLYACARQNNCNKLVLAQHLDDLAESFFMSVMHNGFLRTMKANYKINAGDLSVIRPLVYCRESIMTDFAKAAKLPIINENWYGMDPAVSCECRRFLAHKHLFLQFVFVLQPCMFRGAKRASSGKEALVERGNLIPKLLRQHQASHDALDARRRDSYLAVLHRRGRR